ncbi:MAG TPA: tetratricopeptide repeat protein [Gammaproteobacteria bacterium]|nr:tetratricopeptide repeat protein [Gammaproteobacteria bacterium]
MMRNVLGVFGILILLSACAGNEVRTEDVAQLQRDAAHAYQLKKWKEAETAYVRLASLLPGEPMLWFRLGNVYAHTHQPEKSIAAYREALIRDPKMIKAWHNMGVMSLRSTTHLFIEMVQHLEPDDPLYEKSVATAEALIKIMKQRQESVEALRQMPAPVPAKPATAPVQGDDAEE